MRTGLQKRGPQNKGQRSLKKRKRKEKISYNIRGPFYYYEREISDDFGILS